MNEAAKVVATEGAWAWLESVAKSGCSACSVNHSCGTGLLSRLLGRRSFYSCVKNTLDAKVGEQVIISIPERGLIAASLVLYVLPLCCFVVAAVLTQWLFGVEAATISVAMVALGVGFICAYGMARWLEGKAITRIIMVSKSSFRLAT